MTREGLTPESGPTVYEDPKNATEAPKAVRIPIEQRAEKLHQEELLAELQERAREIEEDLFRAYRIPRADLRVGESTAHILLEKLLKLAKDARAFSYQYRSFPVGGVMLAIQKTRQPSDNPWVVAFDANTKPENVPGTKHCTEQYLMDVLEADSSEIIKVLSFVIVGDVQADDDSKKTQITLTPCIICRNRMVQLIADTGVVAPETEIITARADDMRYQKIQTVADLHTFHGERNGELDV